MKRLIVSIFLLMYVSCTANTRVENKNISVSEDQTEKRGRTVYRVLSKKEYLVNKTILSGGSRKIYEAIRKKNSRLKEKGNAIFCGEFSPKDLTIRIQYVAKEYDDMKSSLLQLTENSPNVYTVHFENEPLLDGIFQETDDQAGTKFWQIGLFPIGAISKISNPTNDLGIFTNRFFDVKSIALNKKKIETIQDCIMNFRIQWCGEQANPKDREWKDCDPPGNEY
ncbi:hypothetical protein [Leptospira licerasiae]|uniref:Lipoprotein n=1 Tax=Leptospira licerasiae str. MMD4847 TaxID=1049971 RepID=A0ABN0H3X5_9LEPT|nr:hypothetical protein [Leptospira licerasiae]EIE03002.1 hypothetical protein LEP1GSC185_1395 [Leptospira licerasiae serovar Varillal str. VAR 010]EJZ40436.1 hypothetical protein LEP1GSC178_0658 [Leptospira licerasiae str. MMD4847]